VWRGGRQCADDVDHDDDEHHHEYDDNHDDEHDGGGHNNDNVTRCALFLLLLLARSAAGQLTACGPAGTACGPGIARIVIGATTTLTPTTTTSGTTTTTQPPVAAPSWVPSMVAAWMLDEASGNARVNAQGTTGRNLTETGGTISNSTTTKIEGTAAALFTSTNSLRSSDAVLETITAPMSCIAWVYPQSATTGYPHLIQIGAAGSSGLQIGFGSNNNLYAQTFVPATVAATPNNAVPVNAWTHSVVTFDGTTLAIYINGVFSASVAVPGYQGPPGPDPFILNDAAPAGTYFAGLLDEVACGKPLLSAASICRICSCGLRGEQCTCTGTAFATTGRNASACGSCTLPADCTAATPP